MSKFATHSHAMAWYENVFVKAARIVEGDCYDWVTQPDGRQAYQCTYDGRRWFRRERNKYHLHPAVYALMRIYRPDDWQQLLLEWPHKSESDPNRLAYTRDERGGEQDRQVITTIGKYLRRHFSHASDDMIRDIVAQHTYGGRIVLVRELDEMIRAVINGPRSCMSKDFCIHCADGVRRHPYAVYDPSLGWGMAVRYDDDGSVLGRCLVFEGDSDKVFVRSYKRERDNASYSGADEAIESWLKAQGYTKQGYWDDGTPLKCYVASGDGFLMPYIDGGTQKVDEDSFCIDDGGNIDAAVTGGTASSGNCTCDNCGARYNDENEGGWVGPYEDTHVCQSCLDDEYTYAYGRRGNQYYVRDSDVVEVDGEYYHDDYLSDNNIVQLANGDYCHLDNAVYIDSEDAYYHVDDDDICFAEDTRGYEMKDDCWQCTESGNWYTDEEESVEIDGDLYHPDNAPEPETTDDESGAAA